MYPFYATLLIDELTAVESEPPWRLLKVSMLSFAFVCSVFFRQTKLLLAQGSIWEYDVTTWKLWKSWKAKQTIPIAVSNGIDCSGPENGCPQWLALWALPAHSSCCSVSYTSANINTCTTRQLVSILLLFLKTPQTKGCSLGLCMHANIPDSAT